MEVKVYHVFDKFLREFFEKKGLKLDSSVHLVAKVTVNPELSTVDQLNAVFACTQNIEHDWSRDLEKNELPVEIVLHFPEGIGHRSSMVGDYFARKGKVWRVDDVGFSLTEFSPVELVTLLTNK